MVKKVRLLIIYIFQTFKWKSMKLISTEENLVIYIFIKNVHLLIDPYENRQKFADLPDQTGKTMF